MAMNRRAFLQSAGLLLSPFASSRAIAALSAQHPIGKAEHCIFIWLGGGMSQIDTFDPKALGDNKSVSKKPKTRESIQLSSRGRLVSRIFEEFKPRNPNQNSAEL